jgi:O6-methylguanine-DNA--protein-cysteine methyltransferase
MSSPQCHCACHGKDGIGALRQELRQTKLELEHSRQQIASLKQNESNLMQRLSEQARRQLEKSSTKFEDLSLGDKRPTQLIRRYGNLYTESRLEALDALDEIAEMSEFADLKGKLLLTILVLSFRNARKNLLSVKVQVRRLLHIPELLGVQFVRTSLASSDAATATAAFDSRGSTLAPDPAVKELDDVISVYLRKTVDRFDLTRNYEEVCERVWDTLFDFPRLRHCSGLLHYIDDCVRLAWALTVQNPPFNINFEHTYFSPDLHTRFHTSDPASDVIRSVLWPVLTEGDNGPCVYKGVVVT